MNMILRNQERVDPIVHEAYQDNRRWTACGLFVGPDASKHVAWNVLRDTTDPATCLWCVAGTTR